MESSGMDVDPAPAAQQFRTDGRQAATARVTSCGVGILERAAGSAQWEAEHTRVIAAVQGPYTLGGRRENPAKAIVEVIFQPCNGLGGPRERRWEQQLQSTLSQLIHTAKFPRTCIQVVIQVIHDDGALLSAALNASTAALLDACIPMHSMFCAASVALRSDNALLLDPDHGEESASSGLITVGFPIRRVAEGYPVLQMQASDLSMCHMAGALPEQAVTDAVALCQAGALHVCQLQYQVIAQAVSSS